MTEKDKPQQPESLKKDENQKEPISFGDEIETYIKHLNSLMEILPLTMELVAAKFLQESKHMKQFVKDNGIQEEKENSKSKFLIPEGSFLRFIELNDKVEISAIAFKLLPKNFIISFVSYYDAYLSRLIRTIFYVRPEILNSSERNILFTDLMSFSDIGEAKEYIIEKEVESVLRDSHLKQFKWLENKLGVKLREELPSFKHFIELTERRNLFVHNNGIVTRQYIEVCKEQEIKDINNIKIGDTLDVEPAYSFNCYKVLFEIGVKLGQVLWRKLLPNDLEAADLHLNQVCYTLLSKEYYSLSENLLSFATDILKKHYSQEIVCIFNVNKALAYYLSGKKDEAMKVLNKYDWSATSSKFKLALAILHEDFEKAESIMIAIGNSNDDLDKDAYRRWPLFKKFRQTETFKTAYRKIFNEEFVYIESKDIDLSEMIKDFMTLKEELKNKKQDSKQEQGVLDEELEDSMKQRS